MKQGWVGGPLRREGGSRHGGQGRPRGLGSLGLQGRMMAPRLLRPVWPGTFPSSVGPASPNPALGLCLPGDPVSGHSPQTPAK